MNIPKHEYEQKRHIFDFCQWINQEFYSLEQEPDFDRLYFERIGDNVKKLLEEAVPVSRLGLYFYREWLRVFIQCYTDNPEYDALIEVQSPSGTECIKVEVTTTEDDDSAMRRQALSRQGFVNLTGPIRHEGRNIISEGEFVEVEEECMRLVRLILQRLERKLKNTYDSATALLVYVTTHRMLEHRHRHHLVEQTKDLLRKGKPALYGVFFCYNSNLGVDGVKNTPSYDFSL